jgi:hypothetical protein
MKYLFLDDERVPSDVTWVNIARTTEWVIVRSNDAAVTWVLENGFPDIISFDHDLGYEAFDTNENGIIIVTDATETKSGYDFAKWLVEYDMETGLMPANFTFTVHSMNPIGAKNIQFLLDNYILHK